MLNIQLVDTRCPNCQKLEAFCREVVEENALQADYITVA